MLLDTAIALVRAFEKCPICGQNTISPEGRELEIDRNRFSRTCPCGWSLKLTVEENRPRKDIPVVSDAEPLPAPCRECWKRDNCDIWERSVCQILNPEADPLDL